MKEQRGEALSALLDGELEELEQKRLLDRLDSDDDLRGRWRSYGLIGEVMRGEAVQVGDLAERAAEFVTELQLPVEKAESGGAG